MKTRCGSAASLTRSSNSFAERQRGVPHRDPARAPVDDELAGGEHLGGRRGAAPQERSDAREQLHVRERAADDVVGAAVERAHALDGVRGGREQDHGHVAVPRPPRLAAAKPQAEVELGEEHEVRPRALGELERLAPARRLEHVEAVVAELPVEVLARLGLRLGDEDCARHARRR